MMQETMPVHTPIAGYGILKKIQPFLLLVLLITVLMAGIHFSIRWYNATPVTTQTHTAPKITTIIPAAIYDLSGGEASGLSTPYNLFDEQADPVKDPSFVPATSPLPKNGVFLYYHKQHGLRMVIDLQATHTINELFWYDKAFESDSVWLYTGSMKNWKQVVAYKTGSPATWGWKNFAINTDSRYLMIRFNSYRSVITEMVLYGKAKEPLQPLPALKGPVLPAPTLAQFTGVNAYDYPATRYMQPFSKVRMYQMIGWYDTDMKPYPSYQVQFNSSYQPKEKLFETWADSMKQQGKQVWISVRGVPKYMEAKGIKEKDKPVTLSGMNTEDPLSYARHANTLFNLAAYFGKSTVKPSDLNATDNNGRTGLDVVTTFENGNEEDAYWTENYWSPIDYFAMSSADYDGHEGKLGPKHGIKNASSSSLLMTSGMIKLDTQRTKTLLFLCQQLRNDQQFLWKGGVQYHHYSNDEVDNSKPPTTGVSPEKDKLRDRLAKVKTFHNRYLPGVPVILGENGYDRMQTSWQKTPLLPGFTEEQSQGIMNIRSLMAAFASGIDQYIYFMMRDATNDDKAPGTFATSGLIGGPQNEKVYQSWYYFNTVVSHLKNYKPDAVVTEEGPVWIYRFRHQQYKDSIAYYMVSPTTNGTVIKNFKLYQKAPANTDMKIIRLVDNSTAGKITTGKTGNGFLTLDVTESPCFVLMKDR